MLGAGLSETDREAALAPFLAHGDALAERVREASGAFAGIDPTPETRLAPEIAELETLAGAIGKHPSSDAWHDEIVDHRTTLARRWRDLAILAANEELNYGEAIRLLHQAQSLEPSEEFRTLLRTDLQTVRELRDEAELPPRVDTVWEGVLPIKKAPELRTLNTIGCLLYGNRPYERDPRYEVSILYIVAAFLPIFPMSRYVVQREGDAYRFFGKLPWTKGMKIHLAASCLAFLGIALWIVYAASPAYGSGGESSYASSSSSSDGFPSSLNDDSQPGDPTSSGAYPEAPGSETPALSSSDPSAPAPMQEMEPEPPSPEETLRAELDTLRADLDSLETQIAAKDAVLTEERKALSAQKRTLDRSRPRTSSARRVRAYNARVDAYERTRRLFNVKIKAHNVKVDLQRRKAKRYNAILGRLDGNTL